MSAIADKNRSFKDVEDFETCVVCKKQKGDMFAMLVSNSKNVSVCTLICFRAFKQLEISALLLLGKKDGKEIENSKVGK